MNGFYEYVKMAVQNIRANKGRSFLTMLGIIIGIASVIAIVSIGEGTKNQMNSEISDIGGGQVYIYVSNDAITEQEWITPEDINAVRDLESVEGVSVAESYDGETVTGKGNFNLMVTAEGPDPKMVNNADMKYGNYFGEREVEEAKPVCVISDADARRLFGTDDVVGMSLDITCYDVTKSFRIAGVTTQKENGTFVSYTYEGMPVTVNIPYSAMNELVGDVDYFYSMTVQVDTSLDSQKVANEIVHLLEKNHQSAGDDYFQIQNFLCSRNFPAGRRNRRYEYHACICNGKNKGDRYPKISWSKNLFHYDAVSGRSSHSYCDWRSDRNYSGNYRSVWNLQRYKRKYADGDQPRNQSQYNYVCNSVFLCSWCILWNLPCEKGSEAQSY